MVSLVPQAAVIPIRADGRVCVLTSRSGARWVLPKGRIETRQTPRQAAAVEAWEEAGLRGEVGGEPIGTYRYKKNGKQHLVTVYVMQVTNVSDDFPEFGQRLREWVSPAAAVTRLEEPELKELIRTVFADALA